MISAVSTLAQQHPQVMGMVAVLVAFGLLRRLRGGGGSGGKASKLPRKRRTSIGSTKLMLSGVIPNDGNYDAIINIRVNFDDGLPAIDAIRKQFVDGVIPYVPFHSLPVQHKAAGPYEWAPVAKVDIERHVTEVHVARDSINGHIDSVINTTLRARREGRPWWEVLLIRDEKGAGVMLIRIHHALGDGISLMEMFAECITDATGKRIDLSNLFSPQRGGASGGKPRVALVKRLGGAALSALRLPLVLVDILRSVAKVAGAAAFGCDTFCTFNNKSRLFPYQNNRFTVYMPSHALSLLKAIKAKIHERSGGASSVTINDIEFALFAGAVRRYLTATGETPENVSLRALTPFAVVEQACPVSKHLTMLRNHWTFLMNSLPLRESSAVERILASHRSWERVKHSTIVPVSFAIHKLSGKVMTHKAQLETNVQLSTRHAVVFSNVPGPQVPIHFAGGHVTSAHMLYPNVGHQAGILSINGWVHMCLVMTSDRDPNEARALLPKCFEEELRAAATELGIHPEVVAASLRVVV